MIACTIICVWSTKNWWTEASLRYPFVVDFRLAQCLDHSDLGPVGQEWVIPPDDNWVDRHLYEFTEKDVWLQGIKCRAQVYKWQSSMALGFSRFCIISATIVFMSQLNLTSLVCCMQHCRHMFMAKGKLIIWIMFGYGTLEKCKLDLCLSV